jgi:hypothetical protein
VAMHFCWRDNDFSMPHQQKNQQREVKQNCQHCKEAFSKQKFEGVKVYLPYFILI